MTHSPTSARPSAAPSRRAPAIRHLIDDLTQETLLRLARADRPLTADEQRAYAVVTARNLLASHFRGQSVQRRHQHRLVDHGGATDPEQRTIDNEETAALASALTRLDPGERDLLLRHEVTGTDLATLAGEAEVSRGAIAMRLARARANLRLEFLLVFRRLSLPTPQCRPVLLALAVGDRRRQAQLAAVGHLETCPTCANLLRPMTERDRRVAAWLIVPIGDAARRVRRAFRSWWVRAVTVTMLLATFGGLIVLVHGAERAGRTDHRPAGQLELGPGGAPPDARGHTSRSPDGPRRPHRQPSRRRPPPPTWRQRQRRPTPARGLLHRPPPDAAAERARRAHRRRRTRRGTRLSAARPAHRARPPGRGRLPLCRERGDRRRRPGRRPSSRQPPGPRRSRFV